MAMKNAISIRKSALQVNYKSHLDDANTVGNVKSIVVLGKVDVRLLLTIRADKSVNARGSHIIHGSNRGLDLLLVRADINDEHKGVKLLNLLHGRLGGKWVLDNTELIQHRTARDTLTWVHWLTCLLTSLWAEEAHILANLSLLLGDRLLEDLGGLAGLRNLLGFLWGSSRLGGLRSSGFLWRHWNELGHDT